MKENTQKHLEQILCSGNVKQLREEIRRILIAEIMAIDAPLDEKNKIIDVIELLEFPIRISYHEVCVKDKTKESKINVPIITASVSGVIFSALLRRLSVVPAMVISIAGAVVIGHFVDKKTCNDAERPMNNIVEVIDTSIEDIIKQIEKIISLIDVLLKPKRVMLDGSFPNIIKWYQEAYSSCDELGEKCSAYFKKRIKNVLDQCYYTLHDYNGENDKLFRKEENVNVNKVIQILPAITNDNGYILPGSLFIPKGKQESKNK